MNCSACGHTDGERAPHLPRLHASFPTLQLALAPALLGLEGIDAREMGAGQRAALLETELGGAA